MTEVNWGALKKNADNATKPAPPGDYVVEIRKCEATQAQTSGNPMYKMQGVIVDGDCQGKTVFNNFNVTVDNAFAMSIFFRNMEALGLDENFFASGPSHEAVCNALVGRRAVFTLDVRQWQGQDRNNVAGIKPLTGAAATAAAALPGGGVSGVSPTSPPVPSGFSAAPSSPPVPSIPTPPSAPPQTPFD